LSTWTRFRYHSNFNIGHGNDPAGHHRLQLRHCQTRLLLRFDDRDHDRAVAAEQAGTVQLGRFAETFQSPKYRASSQLQLTAPRDDGFVERLAAKFVAFIDEDAYQLTRLQLHGVRSSIVALTPRHQGESIRVA